MEPDMIEMGWARVQLVFIERVPRVHLGKSHDYPIKHPKSLLPYQVNLFFSSLRELKFSIGQGRNVWLYRAIPIRFNNSTNNVFYVESSLSSWSNHYTKVAEWGYSDPGVPVQIFITLCILNHLLRPWLKRSVLACRGSKDCSPLSKTWTGFWGPGPFGNLLLK
ncbi:hypothetical protein AAC387_Pa09g1544 [Persea americana]